MFAPPHRVLSMFKCIFQGIQLIIIRASLSDSAEPAVGAVTWVKMKPPRWIRVQILRTNNSGQPKRGHPLAHGKGKQRISDPVPTTRMLKLWNYIRANLADLNTKAGMTSHPPRHYDSKRCNIYCNWTCHHSCSTNNLTCRELIGFFPRIDRIFPSSTSQPYSKG